MRLSSLGDVILATSALSALPPSARVDWLVSSEYVDLLKGHPRIGRVWAFDRKTGLAGWTRLFHEISAEGYHEIIDLHASLRSRWLQALFVLTRPFQKNPSWERVGKQKLRLWGYFLFKAAWPARLRPEPWVARFAKLGGGTGSERPDLSHLLQVDLRDAPERPFVCVMPSSRWEGKIWPAERYADVLEKRGVRAVVLGTHHDKESLRLLELARKRGLSVESGVGRWSLDQTGAVLGRSEGFFGCDTGLAHLAEAVGRPAYVVYGPTRPDQGFGPWRMESRSYFSSTGCSPCSKDGRRCYRVLSRYHCLKTLGADRVEVPGR